MAAAPKFNDPSRGGCSKCGERPTRQFSQLCALHWDQRSAKASVVAKRAWETKRQRLPDFYKPMNADAFWQSLAIQMVAQAITRGILPSLADRDFACNDCGKPACIYEHRDYGRPLEVVPVCASCNKRRGTAKWPSAADYNFKKIEQG